jgi:hypothetical protein
MTAPDPAHSLGVYMRTIARHLSPSVPMSFDEALTYISSQDLGYAAATLIRLEERGVARQTLKSSYLYVRGPAWHRSAKHYRWIHDATQE